MKITVAETATAQMPFKRNEYREIAVRSVDTETMSAPKDVTPSAERILYNRLAEADEKIHSVAQKIRAVDGTMEQIEQNVHRMNKSLDQIIKNYPPYPFGSDARVQELRQFSSLRKMIDQLTIPPPDDTPEKILGDSSKDPQAGDWQMSAGLGAENLVIHHQPMHTGTDGIDIPDLAPTASAKEIQTVYEKTNSALEAIQQKRRAFVTDANRVIAALS